MITYPEALQILKSEALKFRDLDNLKIEIVSLKESVHRILSEDLFSPENYPSFDNSAMDGFAINSEFVNYEIEKHGFCKLDIVGRIAAGDRLEDLEGFPMRMENAVEIMTGSYFPSHYYDAVIKVEDVESNFEADHQLSSIRITQKLKSSENVRRSGEDFKSGQIILKKFDSVEVTHLLALATLGIHTLKVFEKPRIGFLSTGLELSSFENQNLRKGTIRNSTALFLETWMEERHWLAENYGICPDQEEDYIQSLKKSFDEGCLIFISTGAVSMGRHDFVKRALESKLQAQIHFHKAAIRPGKPILFASVVYNNQKRFIFGVPGNPVSTAVGARFFLQPFIDFLFKSSTDPIFQTAVLDDQTTKPEGLRCFFKAKRYMEGSTLKVSALSGQASFRVQPLIESNCWVVLPEKGQQVEKNSLVEVYEL